MDTKQGSREIDPIPRQEDNSNQNDSRGNTRRQFIQKVITTAPVILTVASRPVWAANCTMSGILSGNLSDINVCGGQGCPAVFWAKNQAAWHPAFPPDMMFFECFDRDVFGDGTLHTIINEITEKPEDQIPEERLRGIYSVAALQNAATSVSFELTVPQVISMVQEGIDTDNQGIFDHLRSLNEGKYCPLV